MSRSSARWGHCSSRCLDCHSGEKPSGGLDLSTREGLARGAKSGEVVEPGDPDASVLVEAVVEGRMPPKKVDRLASAEVERLSAGFAKGRGGRGEPCSLGV